MVKLKSSSLKQHSDSALKQHWKHASEYQSLITFPCPRMEPHNQILHLTVIINQQHPRSKPPSQAPIPQVPLNTLRSIMFLVSEKVLYYINTLYINLSHPIIQFPCIHILKYSPRTSIRTEDIHNPQDHSKVVRKLKPIDPHLKYLFSWYLQ